MAKVRKIDKRTLEHMDAAAIARTTREEFAQAAELADSLAVTAKSNSSVTLFGVLAALARRESLIEPDATLDYTISRDA